MSETCLLCGQPEESCLKMSNSEWVRYFNQKNFQYGLIPRPKARAKEAEHLKEKDHHAETEEPERSMSRERFVQEVGFARDQVRA